MQELPCLSWEFLRVIAGVFLFNLGVSGDWWQCGNERAPPALHLPHAHDKSVGLSLFLLTNTQQFHWLCCRTVFPVPVLACTRTGRVGLRNASVHEFSYLGEGRQSRFWGVSLWHNYSLRSLLPGAAVIVFFPVSLVIGTASILHCIERDDYTNKHYVD